MSLICNDYTIEPDHKEYAGIAPYLGQCIFDEDVYPSCDEGWPVVSEDGFVLGWRDWPTGSDYYAVMGSDDDGDPCLVEVDEDGDN